MISLVVPVYNEEVLIFELHCHRRTDITRSENGDRHALLQNHVGAENRIHREHAKCGWGEAEKKNEEAHHDACVRARLLDHRDPPFANEM